MKAKLMSTTPEFLELIDMSNSEDPKFQLSTDVLYIIKFDKEIYTIEIPKGFKTDFASVPKKFRSIIGNVNKYNKCWLLHDWMYSKNCDFKVSRKDADDILKDLLDQKGMDSLDQWLTYTSVRLFGTSRFRR